MRDFTLVCGAGGFIGGHLVKRLIELGMDVRAVDVKPLDRWFQYSGFAQNLPECDLRKLSVCDDVMRNVRHVYNLAADMGGMGFIECNKGLCMLSVLINTHLLIAAQKHEVERYFFASSACVYKAEAQCLEDPKPLVESDAYPAMPEDGYGWEKLFSERMCHHFTQDFNLETRVARLHNVYGPMGTFRGGREKAPAALCRKIAWAKLNGVSEIDVWGNGHQTRTFTWINDCVEGILRIMASGVVIEPINLGSSEIVSINNLIDIIEGIAGYRVKRRYILDAPKGVRGRSSDNTKIKALLNWEPSMNLRTGMNITYDWIESQLNMDNQRVYGETQSS